MKKCKGFRDRLAEYVCDAMLEDERMLLEQHLGDCDACKRELNQMKKVLIEADSLGTDIQTAMASVDWETLPDNIKGVYRISPVCSFEQRGSTVAVRLSTSVEAGVCCPFYRGCTRGCIDNGHYPPPPTSGSCGLRTDRTASIPRDHGRRDG